MTSATMPDLSLRVQSRSAAYRPRRLFGRPGFARVARHFAYVIPEIDSPFRMLEASCDGDDFNCSSVGTGLTTTVTDT